MVHSNLLFWLIAGTGCVVVAWWLALRPRAVMRAIATPASVLVIVMAVLLCLMALTGTDLSDLCSSMRALRLSGLEDFAVRMRA